jgi:hypothetical protein
MTNYAASIALRSRNAMPGLGPRADCAVDRSNEQESLSATEQIRRAEFGKQYSRKRC